MKITSKGLTYKINFLPFCPPLVFQDITTRLDLAHVELSESAC